LIDARQACEMCPILDAGKVAGALLEEASQDIEVHELHHSYLRMFRARGGVQLNSTAVDRLEYENGRWNVFADERKFSAPYVVNAAGAWADEIATLAGLAPL